MCDVLQGAFSNSKSCLLIWTKCCKIWIMCWMAYGGYVCLCTYSTNSRCTLLIFSFVHTSKTLICELYRITAKMNVQCLEILICMIWMAMWDRRLFYIDYQLSSSLQGCVRVRREVHKASCEVVVTPRPMWTWHRRQPHCECSFLVVHIYVDLARFYFLRNNVYGVSDKKCTLIDSYIVHWDWLCINVSRKLDPKLFSPTDKLNVRKKSTKSSHQDWNYRRFHWALDSVRTTRNLLAALYN